MADIQRRAWGWSNEQQAARSNIEVLLAALLDRIECGMLICTPSGELLHANFAAQRELEIGSALTLAGNRVHCTGESVAWSRALNDAASRHRSSLVALPSRGEPLTVAITSLQVDVEQPPAVMVLMGRRTACSSLGLELLAKLHGLTFAECRVLRALIGRGTPREIAASHGVGLATVRSQIQAVRDKLGVRSVEALLLRAAETPPITARY